MNKGHNIVAEGTALGRVIHNPCPVTHDSRIFLCVFRATRRRLGTQSPFHSKDWEPFHGEFAIDPELELTVAAADEHDMMVLVGNPRISLRGHLPALELEEICPALGVIAQSALL